MPQNKITILSTRSLDDELIREAETKDILIDVLPFIKTEFISSEEMKNKIEATLTIAATVVFTSVNAVKAVVQKIKGQKPNWKIFCIGYATKECVEKYFGENSIAGIADNARELAKEIINANISKVIFFCGDQRRDELPDLLKEKNLNVTEVVVYQTVATPQKTEKNYDGILFFSPSAVKSFFQSNQINGATILFAIGNTTAGEIKKITTNKIMISNEPNKKSLLEKAINYFQTDFIHH